MLELFTRTFETEGFRPRWQCGDFSPVHGWTHIVSDVAIFSAYAAIPMALGFFLWQRKDVPFLPIFWLFAGFILSCGLGHLAEACIFWTPWYRFTAILKMCTAIVSWATVIALIPIIPRAMSLPGLAAVNAQLETEVAERRATETKLQDSYDELREFSDGVMDREERMIELKSEVNALLAELGREPRYARMDEPS